MQPPDKVPEAVIASIAKRHIRWLRQGGCPQHDGRFNGHWVEQDDSGLPDFMTPCTCAVSMARFEDILKALRWSGDHYSFNLAGMYVGVELDGYMHT